MTIPDGKKKVPCRKRKSAAANNTFLLLSKSFRSVCQCSVMRLRPMGNWKTSYPDRGLLGQGLCSGPEFSARSQSKQQRHITHQLISIVYIHIYIYIYISRSIGTIASFQHQLPTDCWSKYHHLTVFCCILVTRDNYTTWHWRFVNAGTYHEQDG